MDTVIVIAVIVVIIGLAAGYVIKAKKSGRKCIGCPDGCCDPAKQEGNSASSPCSGNCACCCCSCSVAKDDAE